MAIETINIGSAPNDGTGDPLRTAFNKTNTNFLNITADGGDEITVTDPTTSTDQTLNVALQNIFDNGGGATPDLQAVTDVGNTITDGTDTNTVSASGISVTDFTDTLNLTKASVEILGGINQSILSKDSLYLTDGTDETYYQKANINNNGINYPLPTGASSQIATLADITGGVSDGDKGDITVSGSGTVWTVDNQAITRQKLEHIQTGHVLGRHAAGTGDVQEVSPTQLRTILNVQDGAQVNNISDTNATDLTDGGNTTLHTHDSRYYTETEVDTLLNLRVRTLLNDNVDSSTVTGVTTNTIIKSYLIPANTLAVGDTIDFKSVVSVTGINATKVLRLATNTSNSLTSALTLATLSAAAANRYLSLDRTYTLKTGNVLQSFPTGSSAVTDESTVTNPPDSTTFNPAVDNWFIIAIQPNSALDSFVQTLCYITLMKAKTTV